jgi:hypothetical protein
MKQNRTVDLFCFIHIFGIFKEDMGQMGLFIRISKLFE